MGDTEYFLNGLIHRDDGPAFIGSDGYKEWYRHGVLHNENGPAIEYPDGSYKYYYEGKLHCLDGPAVKYNCGTFEWYVEGEITHIQSPNEEKKEVNLEDEFEENYGYDWDYSSEGNNENEDEYIDNETKYLSIEKPSQFEEIYTYNYGLKEYHLNGELHRENGPALDFSNLNEKPVFKKFLFFNEFYLFGKYYSKEDYEKEMERIRKLQFKYFHHWYDRLDDLSTKTGQRRMIENYEKMQQI